MPTKILAASAAAILVTLTPAAIADEPCAGPGGTVGTPDPTTPERADVCVSVSCDGDSLVALRDWHATPSNVVVLQPPDTIRPVVEVPPAISVSTAPVDVQDDVQDVHIPGRTVDVLVPEPLQQRVDLGFVPLPDLPLPDELRAYTPSATVRSCIEIGPRLPPLP